MRTGNPASANIKTVKIYALFPAVLILAAFAQTPSPKASAPSGTPAQKRAAPDKPAAAPPVKGPFAEFDPNRVVATIGNEKLTAAQFDALVDGLDPQTAAHVRGPGKRQFMENLVMIKVMAKQAVLMHIDQHPNVQKQIEFSRDTILYNNAVKALVENAKVDMDGLHKYYDEHKGDYEQVSVHHILIRFKGSPVPLKPGQADLTEEEALAKAEDIVKRLRAGEDFAAIATSESSDTHSAENGGDLGPVKRGQTVKPFEDAAFSLEVGKISDPVKSQFGYHIIRVDKTESKTFEQARKEIEARLRPELAQKQMNDFKAAEIVKLDEKFFGPPPAAPGTAAVPVPQMK